MYAQTKKSCWRNLVVSVNIQTHWKYVDCGCKRRYRRQQKRQMRTQRTATTTKIENNEMKQAVCKRAKWKRTKNEKRNRNTLNNIKSVQRNNNLLQKNAKKMKFGWHTHSSNRMTIINKLRTITTPTQNFLFIYIENGVCIFLPSFVVYVNVVNLPVFVEEPLHL